LVLLLILADTIEVSEYALEAVGCVIVALGDDLAGDSFALEGGLPFLIFQEALSHFLGLKLRRVVVQGLPATKQCLDDDAVGPHYVLVRRERDTRDGELVAGVL
jgi:hypothetical protein